MNSAKRILIVDDEKDFIEIFRDRLVFEGYEVEVAYDGIEALDKVSGGLFDLILLDLMMPRLDGFEFIRKVRSQGGCYPDVPIIVVTAFGEMMPPAKRRALGKIEVAYKPFDMDGMLELIGKVIENG